MNGHGGPGLPWYQAVGVVVGGIALMGLAGWMMGPQGGPPGTKKSPKKQPQGEGLRIVPVEGNFVPRPEDLSDDDEDGKKSVSKHC